MEETERYQPSGTRYQPEGKPVEEKLDNMATASFFSRVVAFLIDGLAIWGLNQIIVHPIVRLLGLEEFYFLAPVINVSTIATGIIYFLYFILMTYYAKATLGKMITGIHVVDQKGEKLTFPQVIFRELVGRFINNQLWYLPYLVVLFTESRIGLHDYFADTYVVKNSFYEYRKDIKTRLRGEVTPVYRKDDLQGG